MSRIIAETDRLVIRWVTLDDAAFALEVVNDPLWLRFIGDRNVHDIAAAEAYLQNGAMRSYAEHGFGLYMVQQRSDAVRAGICGLVRREGLDDVDLGFAFLPAYRRVGYAVEAARAVIAHARRDCGLTRLAAITSPDNDASIGVLAKLGFEFERMVRLKPEADEVRLFLLRLGA